MQLVWPFNYPRKCFNKFFFQILVDIAKVSVVYNKVSFVYNSKFSKLYKHFSAYLDGDVTLGIIFISYSFYYRLLQSLMEMLQENELSLENIIYDTKGQSKSTTLNMFLDFPFLPDYMKRFGLKLRDSFIYDSSIYPTVFNQETIFQLFSAIVPSAKMASFAEGKDVYFVSLEFKQ